MLQLLNTNLGVWGFYVAYKWHFLTFSCRVCLLLHRHLTQSQWDLITASLKLQSAIVGMKQSSRNYVNEDTITRGRRARPTSAARPSAWSPPGRCCGSGRRSGAGVGVRRASWPGPRILTGSPPRRRSRACAEGDPRCKPSAGPERRSGWGQRPLGTGGGVVGLGLSYIQDVTSEWFLHYWYVNVNLLWWFPPFLVFCV